MIRRFSNVSVFSSRKGPAFCALTIASRSFTRSTGNFHFQKWRSHGFDFVVTKLKSLQIVRNCPQAFLFLLKRDESCCLRGKQHPYHFEKCSKIPLFQTAYKMKYLNIFINFKIMIIKDIEKRHETF